MVLLVASICFFSSFSFSFVSASSSSSFSSYLDYRTAPLKKIPLIGTLQQRNTSCIVDYSTSNYKNHFLFHAHIPKTGGTSISQCMFKFWDMRHQGGIVQGTKVRPPNCRKVAVEKLTPMKYLSCEIYSNGDFSFIISSLKRTNVMPFTMIRHPLSHALSALEHHIKRRGHAACQDFNAIITADRKNVSACAHYDIRNLQTRALSSSDPRSIASGTGSANLTQALLVLRNEMFSVGITGYFRASLCLLAYQMGQLHLHKSVCDCHLGPTNKVIRANESSNSTLKHQNVLSADAADVLYSQYINLDKILYNYALDLFLSRIIVAESNEKIKLLCAHSDGQAIMLHREIVKHSMG
jgi:hypothetical protein